LQWACTVVAVDLVLVTSTDRTCHETQPCVAVFAHNLAGLLLLPLSSQLVVAHIVVVLVFVSLLPPLPLQPVVLLHLKKSVAVLSGQLTQLAVNWVSQDNSKSCKTSCMLQQWMPEDMFHAPKIFNKAVDGLVFGLVPSSAVLICHATKHVDSLSNVHAQSLRGCCLLQPCNWETSCYWICTHRFLDQVSSHEHGKWLICQRCQFGSQQQPGAVMLETVLHDIEVQDLKDHVLVGGAINSDHACPMFGPVGPFDQRMTFSCQWSFCQCWTSSSRALNCCWSNDIPCVDLIDQPALHWICHWVARETQHLLLLWLGKTMDLVLVFHSFHCCMDQLTIWAVIVPVWVSCRSSDQFLVHVHCFLLDGASLCVPQFRSSLLCFSSSWRHTLFHWFCFVFTIVMHLRFGSLKWATMVDVKALQRQNVLWLTLINKIICSVVTLMAREQQQQKELVRLPAFQDPQTLCFCGQGKIETLQFTGNGLNYLFLLLIETQNVMLASIPPSP